MSSCSRLNNVLFMSVVHSIHNLKSYTGKEKAKKRKLLELHYLFIMAKNFMRRHIEDLESTCAYTEMQMRKYKTILLTKSTIKSRKTQQMSLESQISLGKNSSLYKFSVPERGLSKDFFIEQGGY